MSHKPPPFTGALAPVDWSHKWLSYISLLFILQHWYRYLPELPQKKLMEVSSLVSGHYKVESPNVRYTEEFITAEYSYQSTVVTSNSEG
jgi:hypothetical protein